MITCSLCGKRWLTSFLLKLGWRFSHFFLKVELIIVICSFLDVKLSGCWSRIQAFASLSASSFPDIYHNKKVSTEVQQPCLHTMLQVQLKVHSSSYPQSPKTVRLRGHHNLWHFHIHQDSRFPNGLNFCLEVECAPVGSWFCPLVRLDIWC